MTVVPFSSQWRVILLRLFGARVGRGVVIRSGVRVHFPWRLTLGDHVWVGEESWLLNLAPIIIESNVCISQRAFLCTGNHDYTLPTFDLIVKPIKIASGSWVGADCWIGPGVTMESHAVLTAGSVTSKNLEAYGIYRGNPARFVKWRVISPLGISTNDCETETKSGSQPHVSPVSPL